MRSKAVAAAGTMRVSSKAGAAVAREQAWQARRLAPHLREDVLKHLVIETREDAISIKIKKGKGF